MTYLPLFTSTDTSTDPPPQGQMQALRPPTVVTRGTQVLMRSIHGESKIRQ